MFLVGLRCPDCQGNTPPWSGEAIRVPVCWAFKNHHINSSFHCVANTQEATCMPRVFWTHMAILTSHGGSPIQWNPIMRKGWDKAWAPQVVSFNITPLAPPAPASQLEADLATEASIIKWCSNRSNWTRKRRHLLQWCHSHWWPQGGGTGHAALCQE